MLYGLAFAGGLAGSLHCIAMCGGLVAILAAASPRRRLRRVLAYNGARVNMLAVIGAVAGGVGSAVIAWAPIAIAERAVALVAGVVTIAVGLEALGLVAPRSTWLAGRLHAGLGRTVRGLLEAPSPWAPIAFGAVNAFLPCHLVYGFAAMAATSGSMGRGALVMLAFGLGTVPAMLLPASAAAWLRARAGGGMARVAGLAVVAVGVVTVLRGLGGVGAMHVHVH